jgi:hypothetical protein
MFKPVQHLTFEAGGNRLATTLLIKGETVHMIDTNKRKSMLHYFP